jgi:hypothetical protein
MQSICTCCCDCLPLLPTHQQRTSWCWCRLDAEVVVGAAVIEHHLAVVPNSTRSTPLVAMPNSLAPPRNIPESGSDANDSPGAAFRAILHQQRAIQLPQRDPRIIG